MHRRNLIVGSALILAALTSGAAKCEGVGDSPHNDPFPAPITTGPAAPRGGDDEGDPPPPAEWKGDWTSDLNVIVISAWGSPKFGPYHIKIEATDTETGEHITLTGDQNGPGQVIEGGKRFEQEVAYHKGHRTRIHIVFTAFLGGSQKSYVATRDGKRYNRTAVPDPSGKIDITVDTQR